MDNLPIASNLAAGAVARQFAEIAPGAPAVPEAERNPFAPRARAALAAGLVHVAQFVAPHERGVRGRIALRWDV